MAATRRYDFRLIGYVGRYNFSECDSRECASVRCTSGPSRVFPLRLALILE